MEEQVLTKKELGRRLRTARFDREMTLKDVAHRSGLSATHISEVERGKSSPTIGSLQRICEALGRSASEFLLERGAERPTFTKHDQRGSYYSSTSNGDARSYELLSRGIPGGHLRVLIRNSPPKGVTNGPRMVAETVIFTLQGEARYTVGDESCVLQEGDAAQFRLDDGFHAENTGDAPQATLVFLASPTRRQT